MTAKHKFLLVITDGLSYEPAVVQDEIYQARRLGFRVAGIGMDVQGRDMDLQFGDFGWAALDRHSPMPALVSACERADARQRDFRELTPATYKVVQL